MVSLTQSQASQANECGLVATIVRVVRVVGKLTVQPAQTAARAARALSLQHTDSQSYNRMHNILIRYPSWLRPGIVIAPGRDEK